MIDLKEAKEAIEKGRAERANAAHSEINDILTKYNCVFDFAITLTASGNIVPQLRVICND
jgi:hypothetical protein